MPGSGWVNAVLRRGKGKPAAGRKLRAVQRVSPLERFPLPSIAKPPLKTQSRFVEPGKRSDFMDVQFVKVGRQILNLAAVTDAKWDNGKLFVHLAGNSFQSFAGKAAESIWSLLARRALDLDTGEIPTEQ